MNPRVLTPFCEYSGRAPGIFWPTIVGFTKEGIPKGSKNHREKKRERNKKKREQQAKREKAGAVEEGSFRVVDMSRNV